MWTTESWFCKSICQEAQEFWNTSTKASNIFLHVFLSKMCEMNLKWSFVESRMILFTLASFFQWVANYAGLVGSGISFTTCSQRSFSSISNWSVIFKGTKLEAPFNQSHSLKDSESRYTSRTSPQVHKLIVNEVDKTLSRVQTHLPSDQQTQQGQAPLPSIL
jgi:hypothetical protein